MTSTTTTDTDLFVRLADVWAELEERLDRVPVLQRLAEGTVTIDDYRRLLFNLPRSR